VQIRSSKSPGPKEVDSSEVVDCIGKWALLHRGRTEAGDRGQVSTGFGDLARHGRETRFESAALVLARRGARSARCLRVIGLALPAPQGHSRHCLPPEEALWAPGLHASALFRACTHWTRTCVGADVGVCVIFASLPMLWLLLGVKGTL
jgi:hypothetical protein